MAKDIYRKQIIAYSILFAFVSFTPFYAYGADLTFCKRIMNRLNDDLEAYNWNISYYLRVKAKDGIKSLKEKIDPRLVVKSLPNVKTLEL